MLFPIHEIQVSFCYHTDLDINTTFAPYIHNICDYYGFDCSSDSHSSSFRFQTCVDMLRRFPMFEVRNDGSLTLHRIKIFGAARTRIFTDTRYINALNQILPPNLIEVSWIASRGCEDIVLYSRMSIPLRLFPS